VKRRKEPLGFDGYCAIASAMIRSEESNGLYAHAVLTTMWNLMSRVGNAVKICKSHLEWKDDSLLIYFAQENTDHAKSKAGDPRHIHANPYQPEICPILSLGLYFLMMDITTMEGEYVFPMKEEDGRFRYNLKKWMEKEGVKDVIGDGKYGTHSIRKRGATYASSGTTSSPSASALLNRGGWSQGGVLNVYFQYDAAGDQFLGRLLCGLDVSSVTFAVLPPRFKAEYGEIVEELLRNTFS